MNQKEMKKAFANVARQMSEARGEKTVAPQMNPVVRSYSQDVDEGYYDDPEKFQAALKTFESDFLYEMFPEEFAAMEARKVAAAQEEAISRGPTPVEQSIRAPMPIEEIATPSPVKVPQELKAGGRSRLI